MISLASVSVVRGENAVLTDLTLDLRERRIGVVGANGSGKSTFARLLNGLVRPSAGHVVVDGLDTAAKTKEVRRRVGFLFQNPDNQIVYPTVAEDIAFGLKSRKLAREAIDERVRTTLEAFGLEGFGDRLVHELSGGERQMVAFAGVMALEPSWLVLDEPTTLLDLRNTRRIMQAIETIGANVVLVTHDLACLSGFERVVVFDRGRIVADAAPAEAIAAYETLLA